MNATNETTPVIERVDCDRQGRDIHIGIRRGSNTAWLPVMSEEELKELGSMIDNFIKADKENPQQVEIIKAEIERRIETKKHLITNGEAAGLHSELAAEVNCLQSLLGFINNMPEEVPRISNGTKPTSIVSPVGFIPMVDQNCGLEIWVKSNIKMERVANTIKGPHYNAKLRQWEILWNGDDGSYGGAWGNNEEEVTEKFNKVMVEKA